MANQQVRDISSWFFVAPASLAVLSGITIFQAMGHHDSSQPIVSSALTVEQTREIQAGGSSEELDGELATATNQVEGAIEASAEREAYVNASNTEKDGTIDKLQTEIDKLQNERAELLEELTKLQDDFLGAQDEVADYKDEIAGLFGERIKLRDELTCIKAHNTAQEALLVKQQKVLDIFMKAHSHRISAKETYLEAVRENEALGEKD